MINLSMLLSNDLFSDFRLVSGREGLENRVVSTGIFDWEDEGKLREYFPEGALIFTTLSMYKDDREGAEAVIRLMIGNKPAAIAIKDVFFKDIPDDVKAYSDRNKVPVFFFSETFINDLLQMVQNELENDKYYSANGALMETVIKSGSLSTEDKISVLRTMDMRIRTDAMLSIFFSTGDPMVSEPFEKTEDCYYYTSSIRNAFREEKHDEDMVLTLIPYKRGLFALFSCDKGKKDSLDRIGDEVISRAITGNKLENAYIGVGRPFDGKNIEEVFISSVVANASAIIDGKTAKKYSSIGPDKVILGGMKYPESVDYLKEALSVVAGAEKTGTPFLETIVCFAKNGGSIEKTAETMFQHKNTIRYRIERINQLLGTEGLLSAANLDMIARMYMALPYLENLI